MTKIGVIGTINSDTIVLPNGEKKQGWGGILYNLATFSYLTKGKTEIYPVCNVGQDCYPKIMTILKNLPRVCPDYISKVTEKNNHCFLTYNDTENKSEILKGGVPPLVYENISPLLDCNMILVNYISGRDIHLASLRKLRREYSGPIYIDIHSYTLGKRKDGRRFLRIPLSWPEVVQCGDLIQVNRLELAVLVGEHRDMKISDRTLRKHISLYYRYLGKHNINYRSKLLMVTDGVNGCYLSHVNSGKSALKHFPPGRRLVSGDTTGCGDCFSTGFILEWLKSGSPKKAAGTGNDAALLCIMGEIPFYPKLLI